VQEYVGGYEDWVRQRLAEKSAGARNARAAGKPGAPPGQKPKMTRIVARSRKLSFKQQRELDGLPALIEALESEQRALAAKVAGPEFYKEGKETIARSLERVDDLQRELAKVYARWAELEN
jgi:ATP-binding cassette subfamily F protein uup